MNVTVDKKVALITGASRGLGLALAKALADREWRLIINAREPGPLHQAYVALSERTDVTAIVGDISDQTHRQELVAASRVAGGLDLVVNNAGVLGPSPQPKLLQYPIEKLKEVYRINVLAPLALLQAVRHQLSPDAKVINVTSDAAVEAYEGWGGYGSSKAALEQITAVLAVENPTLTVYWVDPGDMRTQMHQEAFPGEDISDRPPPETSIPGFLELIEGTFESGRYLARELKRQVA